MRNPSQEPLQDQDQRVSRRAVIKGLLGIGGMVALGSLVSACGEGSSGSGKSAPTTTTVEQAPQPGSVEYEQLRVKTEYEAQLKRIDAMVTAVLPGVESMLEDASALTPEQADERRLSISITRDDANRVRRFQIIRHETDDPSTPEYDPIDGTLFTISGWYTTNADGERTIKDLSFGRDLETGSRLYLSPSEGGKPASAQFEIGNPHGPNAVYKSWDANPTSVTGYEDGNAGAIDRELAKLSATLDRFEPFAPGVLADMSAAIAA